MLSHYTQSCVCIRLCVWILFRLKGDADQRVFRSWQPAETSTFHDCIYLWAAHTKTMTTTKCFFFAKNVDNIFDIGIVIPLVFDLPAYDPHPLYTRPHFDESPVCSVMPLEWNQWCALAREFHSSTTTYESTLEGVCVIWLYHTNLFQKNIYICIYQQHTCLNKWGKNHVHRELKYIRWERIVKILCTISSHSSSSHVRLFSFFTSSIVQFLYVYDPPLCPLYYCEAAEKL